MATAADYVIAEVEEIVELGQLGPDNVHTPGIFVDAIFEGTNYLKPIERRTVRKR
jgi:3-oxoacid CoA-transferase subunit A